MKFFSKRPASCKGKGNFTDSNQRRIGRVYSISQEICTRFLVLLCCVVVIHWLILPYPPGLLHWHCGNLTIAPVPAKQPWWIWINTSYEFIMNDCITTTKQSTTKPCAYFLGYTVVNYIRYFCVHSLIHALPSLLVQQAKSPLELVHRAVITFHRLMSKW